MPSIVRTHSRVRTRSRCPGLAAAASLVPGLFVLLWGMGCSAPSGDGAPPGGSRFGSTYEIVLSETPAAPDTPPALHGDTVAALVVYPGGQETHEFTLRHEVAGDTARLWLHHDAEGDDGSERVLDDVRLPLPPEVPPASTVLLLNPQGGEPFVLRWPEGR